MNNQNNPVKSLRNKFNKAKQKGNLYLIIAIIVGVFTIGVVGFASWKYFAEISKLENGEFQTVDFSTKEKTEIIDDISNWKTYKNEEYGFEMKYPKIYVITKENKNSIGFVNKKEKELWEQGKIGSPVGNEISLNVYTIEDKNFIVWREKQLSQNKTKEKVEEIMKNMIEIKTDNYDWMNFSWYEKGWGEMSEFFLQKDDIFIEVILLNYKKSDTTFNQMLSTFKFTETNEIEISDWKIYKNEKYEYEVKYPENWYIRESHEPAEKLQRVLFLDINENQGIVVGGGMGHITECYRTGKEKTEDPVERMGVEIISYLKPSNFTWDKWLRENFPIEEYENYTLNGLQGVRITKVNGIFFGDPNIFLESENRLYNIRFLNDHYDIESNDNVKYNGLKIINQMLSTFKFID